MTALQELLNIPNERFERFFKNPNQNPQFFMVWQKNNDAVALKRGLELLDSVLDNEEKELSLNWLSIFLYFPQFKDFFAPENSVEKVWDFFDKVGAGWNDPWVLCVILRAANVYFSFREPNTLIEMMRLVNTYGADEVLKWRNNFILGEFDSFEKFEAVVASGLDMDLYLEVIGR